jgi:hypothetical protein
MFSLFCDYYETNTFDYVMCYICYVIIVLKSLFLVSKVIKWQLLRQKTCSVRLTLLRMMEVEHFISEGAHKPNVLRFWVKVWCLNHL